MIEQILNCNQTYHRLASNYKENQNSSLFVEAKIAKSFSLLVHSVVLFFVDFILKPPMPPTQHPNKQQPVIQ